MLCKVAQMLPASSSFASFVTGGGEHQGVCWSIHAKQDQDLEQSFQEKMMEGGEQVSDPDVQKGPDGIFGIKKGLHIL